MSGSDNHPCLAERLADFVAAVRWDALPEAVRATALNAFRDWLGNAAAGSLTPFGRVVYAVAKAIGLTGGALLVGSREAADPLTAALVNGGASHALEFDDSHKATFYHPGAPAITAALAAAQMIDCDGPTLLAGIVAGYEVGIRVAAALGPEHYRLWHTTGTAGSLAAAAAAARVLRLSSAQTAAAFGLAGTQAAGLWQVLPEAPAAKNLHAGRAAQSGLLAALLAREGLDGPVSILEGNRGLFAAMVPGAADVEACIENLGGRWRILEITLKAYPICGHAMTPVEAALQVGSRLGAAAVGKVVVHSNAISIRIAGNRDPRDGYAAKFSIPYCVAVALSRGRVTQAEFEPAVLKDTAVRDLMRRVELVVDPQYDRIARTIRPARIEAFLGDGRTLEAVSETRRGDPEQPMSDEEMRAKFRSLAALAWGDERARHVDEGMGALPETQTINRWMTRILLAGT